MTEKKEKVINEVKVIVERIELKIEDYKKKYCKEMLQKEKKQIYNSLQSAIIDKEKLKFAYSMSNFSFDTEIKEIDESCTVTRIYNYLTDAINIFLNCYNKELAEMIKGLIYEIKSELSNIKVDIPELAALTDELSIANCIIGYEEKYPELDELQSVISILKNIDSIKPGCLVPATHELYGIKFLLLEFEEIIDDIIEEVTKDGEEIDKNCVNVVIEYIAYMIDWSWFKEFR